MCVFERTRGKDSVGMFKLESVGTCAHVQTLPHMCIYECVCTCAPAKIMHVRACIL